MNRRDFLALVSASCMAPVSRVVSAGGIALPPQDPRALWLRRNGESIKADISTPDGLRAAAWALRDVQAGVVGRPSTNLLRVLAWGQAWLAAYGRHEPYVALSGLRMPETNNRTEGAARHSDHLPRSGLLFHAADVAYRGVDPEYLAKLFFQTRFGGVGYYSRRGFVHVSDNPSRISLWKRN